MLLIDSVSQKSTCLGLTNKYAASSLDKAEAFAGCRLLKSR